MLLRSLALILALLALGGRIEASGQKDAASRNSPMQKSFAIPADRIRPLAPDRGGAIASDRITVDGRPVGYMYRLTPHNRLDSGWFFLAGDEDDSYMADASKHAVYDVNTIANYDPVIIPYLDAPAGSAFFREGEGFVPDPQGAPGPAD